MRALLLALSMSVTVFADQPAIVLEPVAAGLSRPVTIANAGDSRLFIAQQDGVVRVYDGTTLLPEPFLDLRGTVTPTGGERGLLGLAFHPRHAENGFFYVDYTDLAGDTVVARYTVLPSDRDRADPSSAKRILFVDQPFANHNGGQLHFGPDGYLYIGLGDGGSGGDPGNRAQNPSELLGKLLRIDVDGGDPYAIPPSNPFVTTPGARGEIWALGLRNPWRFSFDRASGDLWIADVGQGSWEEVNFQPATSIGGENYGWRRMEGTHYFEPATNCASPSLTLPVVEYGHTGGRCSVTGGYVYRGTRSPRLRGLYLFADFCSGEISAVSRDGHGRIALRLLLDSPIRISTFGEGADGELYVADYGGGAILRVVDQAPIGPRRRAVRK